MKSGTTHAGWRPCAILFDLGGVLVELGGIGQLQAWTPGGFDEAEIWRRWQNARAVRDYETGCLSTGGFVQAAIEELRLQAGADEFREALARWVRWFPETEALLARLSRRHVLGCLSNTNELHWKVLGDTLDMPRYFRHLLPSHQIGWLKPAREAFETALRTLGCPASEVVFLDDNPGNVMAAQELGMRAHRVHGVANAEAALVTLGVDTSGGE